MPRIVKQSNPSWPEREFPYAAQLRVNIPKWVIANLSAPEFTEFQRKRLEYVLFNHLTDDLPDFTLAPEIAKEHAVITAVFGVFTSHKTLSQCEYYFRRFPFREAVISRDDHLQNICEFYLSCFYVMKNRIKTTLNNLKIACPSCKLRVGNFVKAFEKEFDDELHARNQINHRKPLDDIGITRISITGMLSGNEDPHNKMWRFQHVTAYKRFSKEWSLRARSRALRMQVFIEALSAGILTEAAFLRFPDN